MLCSLIESLITVQAIAKMKQSRFSGNDKHQPVRHLTASAAPTPRAYAPRAKLSPPINSHAGPDVSASEEAGIWKVKLEMSKRPITYAHGRTPASKRRRQVDLSTDIEIVDMGFVPNALSTEPLIPKRPASQAAAMASEPSDDLIGMVEAVIGCSRSVAIRALKVKHNNSEAAINAILDNEDLEKLEKDLGWNESLMNNVQPSGTSTAPTRGNSPAGSMQPNTQDEEDHQMAAAMAASQQETGVVRPDGTSMIGPSNRNDSSNQWAMVRYGAQELLADVDVAQRVQDKDSAEPRLLKHLADGDYAPNLLTICHAIPAAREALLLKSWVKNDYGFDEGWWRGQPIQTPTVVHVADGSSAETLTDRHEEVIAEVQRLMAFLGHSDRIYASTGGLTETKMIKEHNLSDGSLLELLVKSWTAAAEAKDASVANLFSTKMGTATEDDMDTPYMAVADIIVRSDTGTNKNLSELLDGHIWSQNLEDDNFIECPAEVLVMTLKHADSENKSSENKLLSVEVPASLSLDKYLKENFETSRALRHEMMQARDKLGKMEAIENRLTTWSYFDSQKAEKDKSKVERERKEKLEKDKDQAGPKEPGKPAEGIRNEDNAKLKVKDLLDHSLAHFSGENRKAADATDASHQPDSPAFPEIAAKLERVMTSIEDKLRQLSVNKEKTRSMLSDLSKSSAGGQGTKHRYTLRGVATKPNITYVLTPKSNKDVEMTGQDAGKLVDVDDNTPAGMQWWRLAYESNGSSASIHRTRAADYDVLRAVELEHSSALLVYASDRATATPLDSQFDLPEPLQQFIARDNRQFKSDLAAAKRDPPRYNYFDSVRHSIEPPETRRNSNSSLNGNASESPVADEIRLSPEEPEKDSAGDTEMTQKANSKSLTLGDTAMGGSSESQDMGVGGAQHIEDTDVKME